MAVTDIKMSLSELFGDNNMKMQSSTIYKALRGEGLRVTPLLSKKLSSESQHSDGPPNNFVAISQKAVSEPQKLVVPSNVVVSDLKPKTPKGRGTGASKTTYVRKIYDLRPNSSKDGLSKRPPSDEGLAVVGQQPPKPRTATKLVMEFKRRDLVTPVSAASTQRVPFTSTKLERQVSRESLKEDDTESKPKMQKKPICGKRGGNLVKEPVKVKSSAPLRRRPQRLTLYNHRKVKSPSDEIIQDVPTKAPPGLKRQQSAQNERIGTPSRPLQSKTQKSMLESPKMAAAGRLQSGRITNLPSSSPTLRRNSAPKNEPKASITKGESRRSETSNANKNVGGSGKKKFWIPTSEAVESWNLYCPASKVKVQRKKKKIKRKPIEFLREKSFSKSGESDVNEDSVDDSTEPDDEEHRRIKEESIRRDLQQKSLDFFNQFRYGEMLRKIIPRMRYNSEIPPNDSAEKRMSEVEIKMRLSLLDDSASRIVELIPKWSSMLMTTRESNREDQIRKTLINAQHVLDCKVDVAKEMLNKYMNSSEHTMSKDEMENIKRHSELVQLDMNSLERMFAAHEKQLADELDEPTFIIS